MENVIIQMANGVKVTSLVLYSIGNCQYLCYAQNRIFVIQDDSSLILGYDEDGPIYGGLHLIEVLVDYAVIPEYDKYLESLSQLELNRYE